MWLPSLWLPPHEATVGGFVVFLSVLCGKVMCIGSNAFCGDQRPLSIVLSFLYYLSAFRICSSVQCTHGLRRLDPTRLILVN